MMYPSSGHADVAARAWPKSRRSRLELAVVPAAVRIARLWTADQLATAWPAPGPADADLIDAAVLAVSELVTNAIQAVSRVAAVSRAPEAVIPGSTLTASVLASRALAGAAWAPEASRPHCTLAGNAIQNPPVAHSAAIGVAGTVSTVPTTIWSAPAAPAGPGSPGGPALPDRILSFGDLPYGPGLPGSGRVTGPAMPADAARPPAPGRVSLVIVRYTTLVRIEVRDSSSVPLPPTCHRDAEDETGRGLTVVAALAERWGWQPEASGKVVWCELAS